MRTLLLLTLALIPLNASADPSTAGGDKPAPAPASRDGEAEFLVAPGGGAFEVPVKIGEICILTFPGEVTHSAVRSANTFEVKPWNADSVAVRALPGASTATLALSTASGAVKVNVTLRVTGAGEPALTLVRFRSVTPEEAYEARVAAEVAKRFTARAAPLEAQRQRVEREILLRRDRTLAERMLRQSAAVKLRAQAKSADPADQVSVRVERVLLLGDDAYVSFAVDNRSKVPFHLARAVVTTDEVSALGQTAILSAAADLAPPRPAAGPRGAATTKPGPGSAATPGRGPGSADAGSAAAPAPAPGPGPTAASGPEGPAVLGVIPVQASAIGVVVLRGAAKLRGKAIRLKVADVAGQRRIQVDHGISVP